MAVSVLSALLPTSGEVQKEISEFAANIPGLGQADVYYPEFFRGSWMVERSLYAVEDKVQPGVPDDDPVLGKAAIRKLRGQLGLEQRYLVRFYKHRGHIIEDRAFNTRNEASADFPRATVTAKWSPDNPNVVTVSVGDRIAREVKITKRLSKDEPRGPGTFLASEFSRVVDMNDEGALLGFGDAPRISAWRRVSRYRVSSAREVEGVLRPDAMSRLTVDYRYSANMPDGEAQLVLKYKEGLVRVK